MSDGESDYGAQWRWVRWKKPPTAQAGLLAHSAPALEFRRGKIEHDMAFREGSYDGEGRSVEQATFFAHSAGAIMGHHVDCPTCSVELDAGPIRSFQFIMANTMQTGIPSCGSATPLAFFLAAS